MSCGDLREREAYRHRPAEEMALRLIAALIAHEIEMRPGFDAFRQDRDFEARLARLNCLAWA
jgi:hypothetical protein